jgi:NitT/TauT family transport system permease protein
VRAAAAVGRTLLLPALVVAIWAIVTGFGFVHEYVLPSPWTVAVTFYDFVFGGVTQQVYSGTFIEHFRASIGRVLGGFLLGSGLAVPLGVLLGHNRALAGFIEPTIQLTRAIPGICWLPLALIWFGIGTGTSLFLIALGSFYAVFISTIGGVRNVDPQLLRAGRCLGARERALLGTVILPAAFPSILSGLRIGLSYSWIYMVLGEFTGTNVGLGALLLQSRDTLDTPLIIVLMILIGALGVASDALMLLLIRRVFRIPLAR